MSLYLDYVQFWQQVAVCESELVPIEEAPVGALLLLHAVCIDLIGQGAVQVVVQLLQGSGQTLLENYTQKYAYNTVRSISDVTCAVITSLGGSIANISVRASLKYWTLLRPSGGT